MSIYNKFIGLVHVGAWPAYTHFFLQPQVGREYGLRFHDKLRLLRQVKRNASSIHSATGWLEHLILVAQVLSLPKSLKGDVIECGCFKGSSTSSLSLACSLTGRRLIVCDSFAGLPEIKEDDRIHRSIIDKRYETYEKGQYSGSLDEVRRNVEKYGDLKCCEFVKGYFEDTLPSIDRDLAMIFLDVDLHESLKTCLKNLWPHLVHGGYLYTHEARQLDYVSRFFNEVWWASELNQPAPGLIGAGCGLPTGLGSGSGLGYTIKGADDLQFAHFCGDPMQAAN